MSVENPGSLISFAERIGVDPSRAAAMFSQASEEYRRDLAARLGITLEQLHNGDYPRQQPSQNEQLEMSM